MAEFTLYNGDCLHVMRGMEPNTIDTIITDPPYGLSFMGKEWDHGVPGVPFWQAALHVAKPGAMLFAFGGTRTQHRLTVAIEDAGWEIRDVIMWVYGSGFPKSHNISKGIDKAAGVDVGETDGSFFTLSGGKSNGGSVFRSDHPQYKKPVGATDAAKIWDGWGTALKPAWEPIIVAMKPTDGTFADNAQKWGVAGLYIDGGRVDGVPGDGRWGRGVESANRSPFASGTEQYIDDIVNPAGRFPANLIHDGSAEVTALFPETMADDGNVSASRFFYCAKAGKEERNAGLAGMPIRNSGAYVMRNAVDTGRDPKAKGNAQMGGETFGQNHHPTVKPLSLMDYLCTLTKTPTGGVVLDPFMGSGSTGASCMRTGRPFKGIDLNAEYVAIAEARIKHWAALSSAEWTAQPIQVTPQPGGFSDLPLFAEATP